MSSLVLGVDPGVSGAVAALHADSGALAWVVDTPAHDRHVSAALLADLLAPETHRIAVAIVERAHAMPGQGVSSVFHYGTAYGTVLGVLGALRIPVEFVTPAKWKRAAGLSPDKAESLRRAVELWPAEAAMFARKRDHGRAEAALIARHGWQARWGGGAPD